MAANRPHRRARAMARASSVLYGCGMRENGGHVEVQGARAVLASAALVAAGWRRATSGTACCTESQEPRHLVLWGSAMAFTNSINCPLLPPCHLAAPGLHPCPRATVTVRRRERHAALKPCRPAPSQVPLVLALVLACTGGWSIDSRFSAWRRSWRSRLNSWRRAKVPLEN